MLNHWLIVVPKDGAAADAISERVEAGLAQFLYYKPERVIVHRGRLDVWVVSTSAGTEAWSMDWPVAVDSEESIAVGGVPTLENIERGVGSIPERLLFAIREYGTEWIQENVGSSFSIGWVRTSAHGGFIEATADFSGYNSCFYLDNARYFAVGNRASFVASFRLRYPEVNDVDTAAMSWLPGTTMIMGTQTVFSGVNRLRAGEILRVRLSSDGTVGTPDCRRTSSDHFERMPGMNLERMDVGSVCDRIGRRVRWCANEGIEFDAHLTGGRDTRLAMGILANQGLLASVGRFKTSGTEKNGDVVVARHLAKAMGVESNHVVSAGGKSDRGLAASEICQILVRSPFIYECQLTPFDGRRFAVARIGDHVTVMGGGGEVYRQEWGSSATLQGEGRARRARGMFAKYDPLGLLSESAKRFHLETVDQELQFLDHMDVVNLPCAFYLEERLSNWGCGHFNNAPSTQLPILLDKGLARIVLSVADVSEHVHFEMLRHCAKELLEIPFFNSRWAEATERRAVSLGLARDPIEVAVEHSFPWQFDCYRRLRNAVIDFCLACGDAFAEEVPRANLEKLRLTPIEPFGSAQIKMLFGLCGAILLAENAWSRQRDCFKGDDTEFRGNQSDTIRRAVTEESRGDSVVAEELERLLLKADQSP